MRYSDRLARYSLGFGAGLFVSGPDLRGVDNLDLDLARGARRLSIRVFGQPDALERLPQWDRDNSAEFGTMLTVAGGMVLVVPQDDLPQDDLQQQDGQARLILRGLDGVTGLLAQLAPLPRALARPHHILQTESLHGANAPAMASPAASRILQMFVDRKTQLYGSLAVAEVAGMVAGPAHDAAVAQLLQALADDGDPDKAALGLKLLLTSGKR